MKIGDMSATIAIGSSGSLSPNAGAAIRHAHEKVVDDIYFLAQKYRPYQTSIWEEEDAPHKRRRRFAGLRRRLLTFRRRGGSHPALEDGRYHRVFPLRDRDNQLHVHPELADPRDKMKVDPALKLLEVAIGEDYAAAIRHDIAAGLFPERLTGARGLTTQEHNAVAVRFRMLIANLRSALEKVMKGQAPIPPDQVYVRTLTERDLAPGESALKGQYGLFNRKDAAGTWRSVAQGRFLCFFSGFYCRAEAEYEAECARYPRQEVDAYALVIGNGDYPCICPFQGGDLGQFANSAVNKGADGRIVEDKRRTNARFARADLIFADNRQGRRGERLAYPVIFLYMLSMPEQDGLFEREVRAWYGQRYWDGFDE